MNDDELVSALKELVKNGSEEQARAFVLEHFKSFPPEYQRRFAVDLFSQALDARLAATEALMALKQQVAGAIEESESEQKSTRKS